MKTLPLIISFIIGGLLIFLFMKQCEEPKIIDNSEEIKDLEDSLKTLQASLAELNSERDSLLSLPPKIDKQIIYREREIDENIAKDSTNAVVEFRQSLTENQEVVDASEMPTLREIGLSAKLMSKVPKLELKINYLNEVIQKDQEIFEDYNHQIKAYQDLKEMQRLALINCEQRLDDEQSFLADRVVAYAGVGVSYGADGKLQPTLQLGFGVRLFTIWRN